MKQVILFLTHKNNLKVKKRFEKIKTDVEGISDIFVLTGNPLLFDETWGNIISFKKSDIQLYRNNGILDTDMDLVRIGLKYILKINYIGEYRYYWLVEYDVYYCGDWKDIIGIKDRSDLLATHIKRYSEMEVDWPWWGTFNCSKNFNPSNLFRCFLPLYRISNNGINLLDRELHRSGAWSGHFECLIPTIIVDSGCKISELGGMSKYTPNSRRGRFYSNFPGNLDAWLGTFRWAPIMTIFYKKMFLYHPIKGLYHKIYAFKYIPGIISKLIYFKLFYKK